MSIGQYCLATKWDDGEAWDHWGLGYYAGTTWHGRHLVVDADGRNIRANGFRKAAPISPEMGSFLWGHRVELEQAGTALWELVETIRDVF